MAMEVPKLRDVPDDHLRAIGLVNLHWAVLETIIFRYTWIFSSMTYEEARAVTTHMSMPQRLDLLCTLVHLIAPDSQEHEAITKFANKEIRKKLATQRNNIVHLDWWPDDLDPSQIKSGLYKAHGKLEEHPLTMTEGQILLVAQEIHTKAVIFSQLLHPLISRAAAWRRAQQESSPDTPERQD